MQVFLAQDLQIQKFTENAFISSRSKTIYMIAKNVKMGPYFKLVFDTGMSSCAVKIVQVTAFDIARNDNRDITKCKGAGGTKDNLTIGPVSHFQ